MASANFFVPADFSDTLATAASWGVGAKMDPLDPLQQMAVADHADWTLLRLVLCSAVATLVLAVASSLQV